MFRIYQSATPQSKKYIANQNFKKNYLQVFDKDFNLLKNIELDFSITHAGMFTGASFIYFQQDSDHEDSLSFYRIQIEQL